MTLPTPEELAYAMHEALTDPVDEAQLRWEQSQGWPVEDEIRERREHMEEALQALGLPNHRDREAEQEAER